MKEETEKKIFEQSTSSEKADHMIKPLSRKEPKQKYNIANPGSQQREPAPGQYPSTFFQSLTLEIGYQKAIYFGDEMRLEEERAQFERMMSSIILDRDADELVRSDRVIP